MTTIRKIIFSPWFLVPAFIMALVVVFLFLILYGVGNDSRRGSLSIFSVIVQRAVNDQFSTAAGPEHIHTKAEYLRAGKSVGEIPLEILKNWPGDCTLDIDLSRLSPKFDKGAFSRILNINTPKVIVFFYGPVPNVSRYLDPKNQDELLSDRPEEFRGLAPKGYEGKITAWFSTDQRLLFSAAIGDEDKWIAWRGGECPLYSYIIFQGAS